MNAREEPLIITSDSLAGLVELAERYRLQHAPAPSSEVEPEAPPRPDDRRRPASCRKPLTQP